MQYHRLGTQEWLLSWVGAMLWDHQPLRPIWHAVRQTATYRALRFFLSGSAGAIASLDAHRTITTTTTTTATASRLSDPQSGLEAAGGRPFRTAGNTDMWPAVSQANAVLQTVPDEFGLPLRHRVIAPLPRRTGDGHGRQRAHRERAGREQRATPAGDREPGHPHGLACDGANATSAKSRRPPTEAA